MLHIGNNIAIPVSIFGAKSYEVASGVQSALIQWWYGHNAVGFFLTAGFLGMMYYFIPKAANRPVYSYRLSIVHFWSLIFLYIWAGPHHLHWTALPDWTQTLGMAFSIMLWMPSWGGMINGIMTLSGRVGQTAHRSRPALLGHRGGLLRHVHLRGAGDVDPRRQRARRTTPTGPSATSIPARWAGSRSSRFGAMYYLVPVLWKRSALYSTRLASWHYWIATLGIVFYIISMWVAGHHAGPDVARLRQVRLPAILVRRIGRRGAPVLRDPHAGGVFFLTGRLIMVYNLIQTVRSPTHRARRRRCPVGAALAAE